MFFGTGLEMNTIFTIFWLALGGFVVWTLVYASRQKRAINARVAQLRREGFSVDHSLAGNIFVAFDLSQRKVAFVFSDATKVYDMSIIRTWQRHWTERNGVRSNHAIHLTLRDPNAPLVKITQLSGQQAEAWDAKLGALLG